MEKHQSVYDYFIGFDVSKDSITAHNSQTGITEDIGNDPASLRRYVKHLNEHCLNICEPTGGYEAALLNTLAARRVPTHRADARKVKAFIRSLGIHGKTDAIDARALAEYGRERQTRLSLWSAPDAMRQELIAVQTAERHRSKAPVTHRKAGRHVNASCQRVLKAVAKEIEKVEEAIAAIMEADERLRTMEKILQSVKGVGPAIASTLIACMPELGKLSRRQVASLAGLAPHPRQSGKMNGYRRVSGGRKEVKRALFMAALVASRHNPDMKAFYQRLLENGKKPIVALTALMRKMLTILNAKIRDYWENAQMS